MTLRNDDAVAVDSTMDRGRIWSYQAGDEAPVDQIAPSPDECRHRLHLGVAADQCQRP